MSPQSGLFDEKLQAVRNELQEREEAMAGCSYRQPRGLHGGAAGVAAQACLPGAKPCLRIIR